MKQIFTGISIILIIILAACTMPGAAPASTSPEIMTAAAMTVNAAINSAPLASPTADLSGQATATPLFEKPSANFGDVVNCRQGPGTDYPRVTQLLPNEPVEIIGFYPPNFWVVASSAGLCWVNGEFVTPMGSFDAVPTVTAPPTPSGNAPDAVILQKWDIFCNFQTGLADISIQWSDSGDLETGYRVIRNDEIVAELPANSTSFAESINLLDGQSVGYRIEAFNPSGSGSSSALALSC